MTENANPMTVSKLKCQITMSLVVPVFLGGGARLFDSLDDRSIKLEPIRALEGPGVAHLKYRIVKAAAP